MLLKQNSHFWSSEEKALPDCKPALPREVGNSNAGIHVGIQKRPRLDLADTGEKVGEGGRIRISFSEKVVV